MTPLSGTSTAEHNAPAPAGPEIIRNVTDLFGRYDCFFLDIYGVLHNGEQPYPETLSFLRAAKAAGKKICLLSNAPFRARVTAGHLEERFGIAPDLYDHLLTSGERAWQMLSERRDPFFSNIGRRCMFFTDEATRHVIEGLDLECVDRLEDAGFLFNGSPDDSRSGEGLEAVIQKALALPEDRRPPMLCINPDRIVNLGARIFKCGGHYAEIYRRQGGPVRYIGKPWPEVYHALWNMAGAPDKSRILAIGDSLLTDVAGACRFGIDSALNLPGIHWEEVCRPPFANDPGWRTMDKVDPDKALAISLSAEHRPAYIICSFSS